jgi:hypothetical protein
MNVMLRTAGLALLAAALLCWFGQDTALARSTRSAIETAQAAPAPPPRAPAAAPRPPGAASSPPGSTAIVPSAAPRAPGGASSAPAAGSSITDVEIERTIAIWAQQMNMKPDQLIEVYARSGKDINELKRHIRAYIAERRRTEPWWQP